MPIPAENIAWPPAPWDYAYKVYRENEAWYIGDTDALEKIYTSERQAKAATHTRNGQPMRGGLVGARGEDREGSERRILPRHALFHRRELARVASRERPSEPRRTVLREIFGDEATGEARRAVDHHIEASIVRHGADATFDDVA